jgi:hypothetical protein
MVGSSKSPAKYRNSDLLLVFSVENIRLHDQATATLLATQHMIKIDVASMKQYNSVD